MARVRRAHGSQVRAVWTVSVASTTAGQRVRPPAHRTLLDETQLAGLRLHLVARRLMGVTEQTVYTAKDETCR